MTGPSPGRSQIELRAEGEVVLVTVWVKPRSRPGLALTRRGVVVSVAAPPVEGKATEQARRALAGALGVPPSAVSLRSGARSRKKVFAVRGLDGDETLRRLEGHAGPGPA